MRVAAEGYPGDSQTAHGVGAGSLHLPAPPEGEQGPLPVPTGSDLAGSDNTPCDRLSWSSFQGTGHAGDSNESSCGGLRTPRQFRNRKIDPRSHGPYKGFRGHFRFVGTATRQTCDYFRYRVTHN